MEERPLEDRLRAEQLGSFLGRGHESLGAFFALAFFALGLRAFLVLGFRAFAALSAFFILGFKAFAAFSAFSALGFKAFATFSAFFTLGFRAFAVFFALGFADFFTLDLAAFAFLARRLSRLSFSWASLVSPPGAFLGALLRNRTICAIR